jgi:siroheme synthase-like protein
MSSAYRTYPIFLRVEGRLCVVVGAGAIAAQKTRELLESGALVHVIGPDVAPAMSEVLAQWPATALWSSRRYRTGDLDEALVVYSATADAETDALVVADGQKRGVLVNIVDVPEKCDFFAGSVVRRGPVTIAIGTGGASPSLAIAIRERIEAALPSRIGELASALAAARPALLAAFPTYAERARRLKAWVEAALPQVDRADPSDLVKWTENAAACGRVCDGSSPCVCAGRVVESKDAA